MNRAALLQLLATSPAAVFLALTTLYARQTDDEQRVGVTTHLNGQGFNASDSALGSSLARQVAAHRPLSARQLAAARRMLPKYAVQLLASGAEWPASEMHAMESFAIELQEAST